MRRWRPSLIRRLTLGFFLAHAAALSVGLIALWPLARMDEEDHVGPDVALSILGENIALVEGRPVLRPGAELADFARSSPGFWFIARANGQELRSGSVPPGIVPLLGGAELKSAELANISGTGLQGEASVEQIEDGGGRITIATGGVDPSSVTFSAWLSYYVREGFIWAPLLTALFTLVGALAAIPIIIGSIRPTTDAAAALDPGDLHKRLPDRNVARELLPLVRAVNAALDRLTEAFERRKRFIADVAHELRTPLAILNMHVELLPEGKSRTDLQRSVYRLAQMVGQMLDAERLALASRRREQVDLVALARHSIADFAPVAVANGYRIGFAADLPEFVVDGDPDAIGRALTNLLGNAVAHGGGEGLIELKVGGDGSIDVCDEGPGVPLEARERVFEPFHRERWDRDGCGLGLHLVREVMRAHGGVAVVVNSDRGAVFRLRFGEAAAAA